MTELIRKKFYFVRHGATDWNEKQLCQGQLDIELNEEGRSQALLLSKFISAFSFSKICTSPLKRALETAQILQSALPSSEIQLIDELKERYWGELQGISSHEMYRIEEREELNPLALSEKGIETREAFKARILKGLNIALTNGESPLIVSHGRLFLCLCEVLNTPLIRQIPNTSLIECSPIDKGWDLTFVKLPLKGSL